MEAAFQSSFASTLLDVLFKKAAAFIDELKKITSSDAAMEKLQTTIVQAEKLLNQVDTFELQGNIKQVLQAQVDKLTALCYDTEDMMDDISLKIADGHFDKPVMKAILSSPRNWTKPHVIDKLQNKLDAILKELNDLVQLTSQPESRVGRSFGHPKPNMEIYLNLRNNDVEAIVEELISVTCNSHGVSIVGVNGLGKTMVAQTITNEARVTANFSLRLWVDLDGCFNAEKIMQQLDRLHANGLSGNCEAPCQGRQSILIIFDNLLEVKLVEWNSFWSHLGANGINGRRYKNIKFLITTFNKSVAKNTRTSSHYLKPLSEEMCKEVILKTAWSHNDNLTDVHSRHALLLAKKCEGLPIVASILGVFLAQYDANDVHDILNEDLWDSELFRDEIFPSLKPCYTKLQAHLKRCLAYFSLFPRNYSFTADDLLQLWVSEGFIQVPKGTLRPLQTAKDYFFDLLGMSIIRRLSDPGTPNEIAKYELNSFGYKFAQLVASRTCLKLVQGVGAYDINTRHLSYTVTDSTLWDTLKKLGGLRTFLSVNKSIGISINPIPPSTFKALTRLRVLSLTQTDISKLPNSIKHLKQLRYLDISHTLIKTLPDTLCKLHALQFLKLVKRKGSLEYLPQDFRDLTNMIYLDWGISDIKNMGLPPNIGKLCNLQTLPLFPVGDNLGYSITELKNMNHLQGSIRITNLEKVRDWATAKGAMLCEKSSLKGLELEWISSKNVTTDAREVLSCLKPHQNLKTLKITNYPADEFSDWLIDSLPELEEMHLCSCSNIQVLPKLGCLPSLKTLVIEDMKSVLNVDRHFFGETHFPKLESLTFKSMERLEKWTVGVESNVMPCLYALTFVDCPMLVNVSSLNHLSSLVELKFECCGELMSLPNLPNSLESLTITESDLLSICCGDGGVDWPKVDCIANVEIDYVRIPTSGYNSLPTPIDQPEDQQSVWRGWHWRNHTVVWFKELRCVYLLIDAWEVQQMSGIALDHRHHSTFQYVTGLDDWSHWTKNTHKYPNPCHLHHPAIHRPTSAPFSSDFLPFLPLLSFLRSISSYSEFLTVLEISPETRRWSLSPRISLFRGIGKVSGTNRSWLA
ncbi:hypothetical protein RND81_05G179800 [Saponaria officinalis]|uniref:Uncharacterized protein n=1 Tax=Saponaria officinalis TaxID=3572 RepID=A0AAW1L0I9_SAPOF